MFQDEAGFGRINKPKYCWCKKGMRPTVPCHHIREYRYTYGAIEPLTGDSFFLILPYCNTECMNVFLRELSAKYQDDYIRAIPCLTCCPDTPKSPCFKAFWSVRTAYVKRNCYIMAMDGAGWHKAKNLTVPDNIELFFIPPCTPEMNPIEQIWKEIRKCGFCNEIFETLNHVIDRLCEVIQNLSKNTIKRITARD